MDRRRSTMHITPTDTRIYGNFHLGEEMMESEWVISTECSIFVRVGGSKCGARVQNRMMFQWGLGD